PGPREHMHVRISPQPSRNHACAPLRKTGAHGALAEKLLSLGAAVLCLFSVTNRFSLRTPAGLQRRFRDIPRIRVKVAAEILQS
ncbi:MAG: hypothetical protein ACREEV_05735, partial [Dongiaceae bacterium]